MTTLDVPEPQVAISSEGDSRLPGHARLLLSRLGDSGRWIASNPDWEVDALDLSDYTVVPLSRSSPPPDRVGGLLYAFDGIDEDQRERVRAEARSFASLLAPGALAPLVSEAD